MYVCVWGGASGCLEPPLSVSGLVCSLCAPHTHTLCPSQWLFLLGCFSSEPLESRTQGCLPQKIPSWTADGVTYPFLMAFPVSLGVWCTVLSLKGGLELSD